jgi:ferrochelatase
MAYGGPDSLADVEPFLTDIRGGRPTSAELVEEIRGRYAAIGGRSPLLSISRAQAEALQKRLDETAPGDFRVYVGMRHWRPFIREAVAEIAAAGHRRLVALCLAPHYSELSIGAYMAKLDQAVEEQEAAGVSFDVHRVESWHDEPLFLEAIAEKVRRALRRWPEDERGHVQVLFTAHSLPELIVERGDPYPEQLLATARGVAERLGGLEGWRFCYQSAGASGIPWLGPAIEEVIPGLAAAGHRDALVVPVGFVADHVEILYDLDIEARGIAAEHGVRLERTESLNTTPDFIQALEEVVCEAARGG